MLLEKRFWKLWVLILVKLSCSSTEGVSFTVHPITVTIDSDEVVNFTCTLDISSSGDASLNWHSPYYSHSKLHPGQNSDGGHNLDIESISEFEDQEAGLLTSTLTLIAKPEYNNVAFQCESNHRQVWSQAAALEVRTPATGTTTQLESATCEPPTTIQPTPTCNTTKTVTVTETVFITPEPCNCEMHSRSLNNPMLTTIWSIVYLGLLTVLAMILQ